MREEILRQELAIKAEKLQELEELKYSVSYALTPFTSHRVTDRIGELIVKCSELREQIEEIQKVLSRQK